MTPDVPAEVYAALRASDMAVHAGSAFGRRVARCRWCGRHVDTVLRRGREQLAPHPYVPGDPGSVDCHGGGRPVDEIPPRRTT